MSTEDHYIPPEGFVRVAGVNVGQYPVVQATDASELPTGQQFVDIDGTLVRYREPNYDQSLENIIGFAEDLSRRFIRDGEHGVNVRGHIEERRAAYEHARDNENSDKERIRGALLAAALFNELNDLLQEKIILLAQGSDLTPEKNNAINAHYAELNTLLQYIQMRDGAIDTDGILGEAVGEGPKTLILATGVASTEASTKKAGAEILKMLAPSLSGEAQATAHTILQGVYAERYKKTADAKQAIDLMMAEMIDAVNHSPALRNAMAENESGLDDPVAMIEQLASAAKRRIETGRSEYPAYDDAHVDWDEALAKLRRATNVLPRSDDMLVAGLGHIIEGRNLIMKMTQMRAEMPTTISGYMAVRAIGRADTLMVLAMETDDNLYQHTNGIFALDRLAKAALRSEFQDVDATRSHQAFADAVQHIQAVIDGVDSAQKRPGTETAKTIALLEQALGFVQNVVAEVKNIIPEPGEMTPRRHAIEEFRHRVKRGIEALERLYEPMESRPMIELARTQTRHGVQYFTTGGGGQAGMTGGTPPAR